MADTTVVETWRPVPGAPGYEVSNLGRMRVTRTTYLRGAKVGRTGYPTVLLNCSGRKRFVGIHILVAEAFLGPRPPGLHVAHSNGVPDDNRVENLRYATPKENAADRDRHGRGNGGRNLKIVRRTDAQFNALMRDWAAGNGERGHLRELRKKHGPFYAGIFQTDRAKRWKAANL